LEERGGGGGRLLFQAICIVGARVYHRGGTVSPQAAVARAGGLLTERSIHCEKRRERGCGVRAGIPCIGAGQLLFGCNRRRDDRKLAGTVGLGMPANTKLWLASLAPVTRQLVSCAKVVSRKSRFVGDQRQVCHPHAVARSSRSATNERSHDVDDAAAAT